MLKIKCRPVSHKSCQTKFPPTKSSIACLGTAFLVVSLLFKGSASAQVVPPGVIVGGKTKSEWIEARTKWVYSAPPGIHANEIDGTYNHLGQEGPVWFMGSSSLDGNIEKAVAVPADKYVLQPIAVSLWTSDDPNEPIEDLVRDFHDDFDLMSFDLNGFSIPEEELMVDYRESTGAFEYDFPPPNFGSLTESISGYAAVEGTFLMLEPLPPGQHVIRGELGVSSEDLFVEAELRLFSFDNPADFDFDGDVDSADRANQLANWTGASILGEGVRMLFPDGDTDFDGDIDTADRTTLLQNWNAAEAGNTQEGNAKLIYTPENGYVTLDTSETTTGKIVSFALANAIGTDLYIEEINTVEGFWPENIKLPFADFGTNTDQEFFQIGQTDDSNQGAGPTIDLGEVFPDGMADSQTLSEYLTLAEYVSETGIGGRFDLIVRGEGDFDADFALTAQDMDLLSHEIRKPEPRVWFDLNGDDLVDQADRDAWVELLANTSFGDADLNGSVEFADFLSLSSNFGQEGGWAQGDFDGSGDVQFADFLLLSTNFGQTTEAVATVPEPDIQISMMFLVSVVLWRWRRKSY